MRAIIAAALIIATATASPRRVTLPGATVVEAAPSDHAVQRRVQAGVAEVRLPIPPRHMWGWGGTLRGYCGETSFQMAGIYHGNWVTSEQMRMAADGTELLLAVNDKDAAKAMRFEYEAWDWKKHEAPQHKAFLAWARRHLEAGHPVVAGFFAKEPNGDGDYDHIMPVVGFKGPQGSDAVDALLYHDLYMNTTRELDTRTMVQTRHQCSQHAHPTHPWVFCLPANYDYAIALKGNVATGAERFQLHMPAWYEPDYGFEDERHQPIVPFTVTGTASGLTAGQHYAVLRYDYLNLLPTDNFLRGAYAKRFDFVATSAAVTLRAFDTFDSDSTVFYRVVAV